MNRHTSISISILLVIATSVAMTSCGSKSADTTWYSQYEWANGLELVPHPTIDQEEFANQYAKNKLYWDKTFEFLKTTDLDTISPGRYIIDDGNVTAFVSIGKPNPLDSIKWETHDNFTDLQYIVRGKTLMGLAPRSEGTVTEEYDPRRDISFYSVNGELLEAVPGTFFLFFPSDIHRPAIHVDGFDEVKRVLIKVRSNTPAE